MTDPSHNRAYAETMEILPTLEFFADLTVTVGTPIEIGATVHGHRRVIPILGGQARGQGWSAQVLPGGADFQLALTPELTELDARYVLETDAGERIFVQNRAVRVAAPEIIAKLLRGEAVDPAGIYFRCSPSFETSAPRLRWISERLFVGGGVRHPDRVEMRFFCVQ